MSDLAEGTRQNMQSAPYPSERSLLNKKKKKTAFFRPAAHYPHRSVFSNK